MTTTTSPLRLHSAVIAPANTPLRMFEARTFIVAGTEYLIRVTRLGSTAYQIDVRHAAGWSRPELSRLFEKAGCGRWMGRGTAVGSSDSDPRRSAFLYLNELAETFIAEQNERPATCEPRNGTACPEAWTNRDGSCKHSVTPRCATPRRHDARTCGHFRADGTER